MQGTGWLVGCLGLLVGSCAPDRFYVEGHHGWGVIEPGFKDGEFDTEADAVVLGLSFPLQEAPGSAVNNPCPFPHWAPAPPTAKPATSGGGIPWEEIILIGGTIAGTVATQKGHKGYKAFKSKRKAIA